MIPVNRCCVSSLCLIWSQSSPIITNDTDHSTVHGCTCGGGQVRGPTERCRCQVWCGPVPGVCHPSAACTARTRQCWAVTRFRDFIIMGDCGMSALVIIVNLSSYPEIQVSPIFAVFFTFMLNFHRRNIISLSGDIIWHWNCRCPQDSCVIRFMFFLSFISLIIDGVVTQIVCNRFPNYLSFVV